MFLTTTPNLDSTMLNNSDLLMTHLREEEVALESLLVAARGVWKALASRDGEQLTIALQAEAAGLQVGETMREKRRQFRESMAAQLQTTVAEITLSRMTEASSSETQVEIARCRDRLTEMSTELAKLNRQNAAMIRQSLDLTRSIIGQLTGTGPHFASYNAAGKSDMPHIGPVVQWGG